MNEVQTFLLEGRGIRGALVRLEETWQQVIALHNYPADLRRLLGESLAATVLLASSLKARPRVSMQLQGDGALKLLLIQCSEELRVRGMAQCESRPHGEPLLGDGRALASALLELVQDEPRRTRLARSGRAEAERWSWAASTEALVMRYRQAIRVRDLARPQRQPA